MDFTETIREKSRLQFERQSDHYGKGHILSDTSDLAAARSHLKLQGDEPLLDVATGGGHAAVFFARLGLRVTATDISESMLAATASLADEAGVKLDTRCAPAEKLPFDDSSFAVVACRVAAHHFACPASFMMEVSRVLTPGGRFLLIDGTVEDGEPEAEEWLHEVESLRDPSHNRFVSPDRWSHLCGHVGMRVIHREVKPFKQPDLEWYFKTAGTSKKNREAVREMVAEAAEAPRKVFGIRQESGKWVWWWQHLTLVARKI